MTLHIRHVSKTYSNGVHALKDVNLTIPAGMYGLLGPNGAGKSTLMRMIATLQEPDEGSILLGDIDVLNRKDEDERRSATSIDPNHLLIDLDVNDNNKTVKSGTEGA